MTCSIRGIPEAMKDAAARDKNPAQVLPSDPGAPLSTRVRCGHRPGSERSRIRSWDAYS